MILLGGISDSGGTDSIVDGDTFKKACYTSVTSLGGRVLSFQEPVVAQNYYYAKVSFPNEENLYILLNSIYPFIAYATSHRAYSMTFKDHKELTTTIRHLYSDMYRVLQQVELNETLRLKEAKSDMVVLNENTLNKWDMDNIKYWKPKTVGEVVFNYWD
ncbi:hypothetical protein FIU87_13445 [Bacillus sp. THAF10]|uniref:hypothetical protein n=1 Tax=Bacillus sp. THAF10 TaxID=2587848 RepID=UPI0012681801|nr:hypothetical protein [Bacillus sp. THAF10]QFT89660.1 hypothetical protein FIU87_13445 [Bacillus sp. THAF10]